jgi:hypothetical protein
MPNTDVAVKTTCMSRRPHAPLSRANPAQHPLLTRYTTNAQREAGTFMATSVAPITPVRAPNHSRKESMLHLLAAL